MGRFGFGVSRCQGVRMHGVPGTPLQQEGHRGGVELQSAVEVLQSALVLAEADVRRGALGVHEARARVGVDGGRVVPQRGRMLAARDRCIAQLQRARRVLRCARIWREPRGSQLDGAMAGLGRVRVRCTRSCFLECSCLERLSVTCVESRRARHSPFPLGKKGGCDFRKSCSEV
jgi:hypothetical protein